MLKMFLNPSTLEKEMHQDSSLEVEGLQVYNATDPHALYASLGEPYLCHIFYGYSSFRISYSDPPCQS